jgi:tryptophanyl-tRNA synthetase
VRIVSGIQPSGRLHLGNWFGAIRQFVELQGAGEALYFIADLHALTTVRDGTKVRASAFETAAGLLALGIDPARSALFRQSDVPEVLELYWILGTVAPVSHLERAHAYKDKVAHGLAADFGLFAYPVLMAADILLYAADLVPVGKDQVQHVEFARDWATRFNVAYVRGYDPQDPLGSAGHLPGLLKLPEYRVAADARFLPGIDGQKMSRTYGNGIELFAGESEVRRQIRAIKTDSTPIDAPKPVEGSPLYELLRAVVSANEFAAIDRSWRQGGTGYGAYKEQLAEFFLSRFGEARRRYSALAADAAGVERVLRAGAQRARNAAIPVIEAVRRAVGVSPWTGATDRR